MENLGKRAESAERDGQGTLYIPGTSPARSNGGHGRAYYGSGWIDAAAAPRLLAGIGLATGLCANRMQGTPTLGKSYRRGCGLGI